MSENDAPITKGQVALVISAIMIALPLAMWLLTLEADLQARIDDVRDDVRDLRLLLCDEPQHATKSSCRMERVR